MKEQFVTKKINADAMALIGQVNEILRAYARKGYRLTLRQIYYQLVSTNTVPNTIQSYKRVGAIINDGRLAGLVDWHMVVDLGRDTTTNGHWGSVHDILVACAAQFWYDTWADQPWYVEVMVEKEALESILEPVCKAEDVPFSANKGYSSSSAMYVADKRLRAALERGQHVRVIYLGDHDPSGIDMSRDIDQRLKLFAGFTEHDADTDTYFETGEFYDQQFEVERIALNMDQVEEYNPPPQPLKTKKNGELSDARGNKYRDQFGDESWELDALDVTIMADLVRDAIRHRRDDSIWATSIARRDRARQALTDLAATIDDDIDETEDPK